MIQNKSKIIILLVLSIICIFSNQIQKESQIQQGDSLGSINENASVQDSVDVIQLLGDGEQDTLQEESEIDDDSSINVVEEHSTTHQTTPQTDGESHTQEGHQQNEGHGNTTQHEGAGHESESGELKPDDPLFYVYVFMSAFLVCFAGLCSGLTVGYLSIDDLQLEIKLENGTEQEKEAAKKIIPILKNHHVLLCTLLISNAVAMETLPICLDAVVPSYLAIFISTISVVVFGEVIPQAYCTGPSQLFIAEKMAPLVQILIFSLQCITKYIAQGLDKLLGTHEKQRMTNEELKYLVQLYESLIPKCLNCQTNVQQREVNPPLSFKCKRCEQNKSEKTYFQCVHNCYGQIICFECFDSKAILYPTEITVFKSVLNKISNKTDRHGNAHGEDEEDDEEQEKLISERKGFVSAGNIFYVDTNEKINKQSIKKISDKCYTHILVRDPHTNSLVGAVKVKNLILYANQDTNIEFRERMYKKIAYVNDDDNFLTVINKFKNQNANLAVVLEAKGTGNEKDKKAFKFQERKSLNQDDSDNEVVNVNDYASLMPTSQVNKKKKKARQNKSAELQYAGKKIVGIFTLKDVFEHLVDIDFGESNVEDEILKKRFQEIQKTYEEQKEKEKKTLDSILDLYDLKQKGIGTVIKAKQKFMQNKSKNKQK